jgi:hypothetical protein
MAPLESVFVIVVRNEEEFGDSVPVRGCHRVSEFIEKMRVRPQLRYALLGCVVKLQFIDGREISNSMSIEQLCCALEAFSLRDRLLQAALVEASVADYHPYIPGTSILGLPYKSQLSYLEKILNSANFLPNVSLGPLKVLGRDETVKNFNKELYRRHRFLKNLKPHEIISDKMVHTLPLLVGGVGTGKTRLLDELGEISRRLIFESDFQDDFKGDILKGAFFNISFGNESDSPYCEEDLDLGIELAICKRIFKKIGLTYDLFFELKDIPNILDFVIQFLGKRFGGLVVLGVDQVERVCARSQREFENLISLLSGLNCRSDFLFTAIVSGTAIGKIEAAIFKFALRPLYLPLPPLSDSVVTEILDLGVSGVYCNDEDTKKNLMNLISDVGGHCKAIEFLNESIEDYRMENPGQSCLDFEVIQASTKRKLMSSYNHTDLVDLLVPICCSLLSKCVGKNQVFSCGNRTYLELEESGIIYLEEAPLSGFMIRIPFIFISCFICQLPCKLTRFLSEVLYENNSRICSWSEFNRKHIYLKNGLSQILGIDLDWVSDTLRLNSFHSIEKILDASKLSSEYCWIPNSDCWNVSPCFEKRYREMDLENIEGYTMIILTTSRRIDQLHDLIRYFESRLSQKLRAVLSAECCNSSRMLCFFLSDMGEALQEMEDMPGGIISVGVISAVSFYGNTFLQRLRRR